MAKKIYFNTTRAKKVKVDGVKVKKIYLGTVCGFSSGHKWTKWNSVLSYVDTTRQVSANETFWGVDHKYKYFIRGNGYSFNASNGVYTLSNPSNMGKITEDRYQSTSAPYVGYPASSWDQSTFSQIAGNGDSKFYYAYWNRVYCTSASLVHYAVANYSKGDTPLGIVENDDINAYPSNGRSPYDGCWYVLVE